MIILKPLSLIPYNLLLNIAGTLGIFAGLFGISFLIGFHELGHFLFAKIFKVRTPSFSIGFGPQLISKKIGDTQFSLSAIPLGGYVELAGAAEPGQGEQKEAHRDDEHSFKSKPYYQKLLIMSGGILFNLIFAYSVFIFLFNVGIPASDYLPINITPTVQSVPENATSNGKLQPGDVIKSINGIPVSKETMELFFKEIAEKPNQTIALVVERDNQEMNLEVMTESKTIGQTNKGILDITFIKEPIAPRPFMTALANGITLTNKIFLGTIASFKHIFTKRDVSQMGGPISIISETAKGASKGFKNFLILLAIISINLAVLNLIPLPILDGGQILFYTIEAIIGRSIPNKIREYIFIGTWLLLFTLIIYLSYKDILRIAQTFFGK